jgi:hypothetical protein
MSNRRLTRCTNGYSKKYANHAAMLSLMYFTYNYTRKHMTLKKTPAMAIGVADHQWTFEELAAMTGRYMQAQAEREFERAFSLKFKLS